MMSKRIQNQLTYQHKSIKHQTKISHRKVGNEENSLLETSLRHNIEGNGLGHTISSLPVEEIDYGTNEL